MAVINTPLTRKRCPLCLAILELTYVADGAVSTTKFDGHTAESCARSTAQRIKVLEEIHLRDSQQLDMQNQAIGELGEALGSWVALVDAGRRWLMHRAKRKDDLAHLRSAFGTGDRTANHPLWQAEEEVAVALEKTIAAIEKKIRS